MLRRAVDLLLSALVRLILGVFFRRVEVVGAERLSRDGARLYVGNHLNGLIDPALAIGWLPPGIRMLAKSTLWSHVPAGLFVRLAGAVPVYRRMDAGADPSRNVEMFARCFEILGEGGAIALFPEGISHNQPNLQQLKTGAARIALGTLARHPEVGLAIVPFGLVFEDRERFRSSVLMEIGEPIDPAVFAATDSGGSQPDPESVQALTAEIERSLTGVTLNYPSWREAAVLRRAADLYFTDQAGAHPAAELAAALPYRRAFAEAYPEMVERLPERTAEATRDARAYFRLLDLTGLDDRQVTARYAPAVVARFLARTLVRLLVLLPLGLLGTAIHWLPYRIPGWIADALPIEGDQKATYKLVISLFLFPALWLTVAAMVTGRWGGTAGLVTGVLLPILGYTALRLKERLERLVAEARAFLVLGGRRSPAVELRRRRERLLASIKVLAGRYWDSGNSD